MAERKATTKSASLTPAVISSACDIIEECSTIIAFLDEFHSRTPVVEMTDDAESGHCYILHHVRDRLDEARGALVSAPLEAADG